MKILFAFLAIGFSAEIKCSHPKLTRLQNEIESHKERKFEYNEVSRAFVEKNNNLRKLISNITHDLEEMEISIAQCSHLVDVCAKKTAECPREVLSCLQSDCNKRFGLSTSFNSRGRQSSRHCYTHACQKCRACNCKTCDITCTEPWMEDAKRYRSDAECIIENYQLLRLEKLALSAREDEAREAYFQFRNNNKYLLAEFELKRKHFEEYKKHYENCAASLVGCEKQLHICNDEVKKCKAECKISPKYLHGNGKYKTILFRHEKFQISDLSSVISCPDWKAKCPDCDRCYCDRCPRCLA